MMHEDQTKKLYQAITDIDDQWVEEAQSEELSSVKIITGKPKRNWASIAVAACAVLAFGGGLLFLHSRLGPEKPPVGTSVDSAETASNTLQSTTTTTTTQPFDEEEQELHGLCESLARTFFDLVTKPVYLGVPIEDCINMCDYVENEKFAAWLHYRAFNSEFTDGTITSFVYTPEEVRSDGDFRFVTATIAVDVTLFSGSYHQKIYREQCFVLDKKDGVFTILDWYDGSDNSPDRELRSLNGEFDDDYFKTYWTLNTNDTGKAFVDELLGYNSSAYAYELPEIAADETDVTFGSSGAQYDYDCNAEEIQLLRDALANLNCTLTDADTGAWRTQWLISTDAWTLSITTDYGIVFWDDTINERVYLTDFSGAVQELVRTMLEMTRYHRMTHTIFDWLFLHDPDDLTQLIAIPDRQQAWSLVEGMRLLPCEGSFDDLVDPVTISLSIAESDGMNPVSGDLYYIDSTGRVCWFNTNDNADNKFFMYQDHTDSTAQLYAMLKPLLPE